MIEAALSAPDAGAATTTPAGRIPWSVRANSPASMPGLRRRSMRESRPRRPRRHWAAAMSTIARSPPCARPSRIPATLHSTSALPPSVRNVSPSRSPRRAAADGVSHALRASRRLAISGTVVDPLLATNAGCSCTARSGSMPIMRSGASRPASAASTSTIGLAAITSGRVAIAAKAASSKPLRGPRISRSARPERARAARSISASADV